MVPAGESTWHPVGSGILDCYYNVTHLPIGVTVRFRVACANRAGQGPFSNPSEKVLVRGTQGQCDGGGGGQEKKGTLSPGSTPFSEHHGFAARGTLVMIFLVFPQIPQLCYLLLTETPLLPQGQPGPRLRTLLPHWPHPRPLLQLLVPQAPSQLLSALHLPQHPPARPCPHSRLWVHHPKPPHESTEACRPPGRQSPPHPVPRSP